MNRRTLTSLIAFTLISLFGLVSCSKDSKPDKKEASGTTAAKSEKAAESPSKSKEKLVVGHDIWVGYSGVFLAKEQGYFEELGLEVELKPFSNPGDTLPALVSKTLDIGLATLQNLALLRGNSEADVVAVALLDSSNGADAVVAKEGINSMADLKGKTVAATLGEVNHFLLLLGLKQAGLSPDDVKVTSMSADDAGAAFVSGKVDAAVTWEPWVTKAKKKGGNIVFTSADAPDTIMDSVVVRRSDFEERKATVEKFLKGIDKGVAYLSEHPDKAHKVIGKYLDAPPEDVKGMLEGDKIYSLKDNERMFGTAAKPGPVYDSMKKVVEFAKEAELIKQSPEPKEMFEASLVR